MKDERLVIVTTRESAEAFVRVLSQQYLGYTKDDGKVRELLSQTERALQEKSA